MAKAKVYQWLEQKRMDCGLLRRYDAREWKHWWTVRGHTAITESVGRGLFQCWLTLDGKVTKPEKERA